MRLLQDLSVFRQFIKTTYHFTKEGTFSLMAELTTTGDGAAPATITSSAGVAVNSLLAAVPRKSVFCGNLANWRSWRWGVLIG
jgi:hypothetical protein